jgi:hypothetical protein
MNRQSEAPRDDRVDSASKGFSELVREGCEGYVLLGIGLPIAAYVFHGVKLYFVAAMRAASASIARSSERSRRSTLYTSIGGSYVREGML